MSDSIEMHWQNEVEKHAPSPIVSDTKAFLRLFSESSSLSLSTAFFQQSSLEIPSFECTLEFDAARHDPLSPHFVHPTWTKNLPFELVRYYFESFRLDERHWNPPLGGDFHKYLPGAKVLLEMVHGNVGTACRVIRWGIGFAQKGPPAFPWLCKTALPIMMEKWMFTR